LALYQRLAVVIASLTIVFALVGCGGKDSAAVATGRCTGGSTRPLAPEEVVRIFRAQGLSAVTSTRAQDCGESIAYDVANTAVQDHEGWLTCSLFGTPIFRRVPALDLEARSNSPIFSGRKATFHFANIECFFYPDTDEQMARFARAARQIARID
jgi:hypothetical protein